MTDLLALFDTAEVLVVVGSVNDTPVFPTGVLERSVNEDALARRAVGAPVTATDVEDTVLAYTLADPIGNFVIDRRSGQIMVANGATLDHEIDGFASGDCDRDRLAGCYWREVGDDRGHDDVNEAPVAMNDSASTDEDVAVEVEVLANDVDQDEGDSLTVSVEQPQRGSATVQADGKVLYTPHREHVR